MASEKQKLWTDESTAAAYQAVIDRKGLREMSRLYAIQVETLRRRVNESFELGCRPGLAIIITDEQENLLCEYTIKIADTEYRLTKEDVQHLAYSVQRKSIVNIHSKMERQDIGGLTVLNPIILS